MARMLLQRRANGTCCGPRTLIPIIKVHPHHRQVAAVENINTTIPIRKAGTIRPVHRVQPQPRDARVSIVTTGSHLRHNWKLYHRSTRPIGNCWACTRNTITHRNGSNNSSSTKGIACGTMPLPIPLCKRTTTLGRKAAWLLRHQQQQQRRRNNNRTISTWRPDRFCAWPCTRTPFVLPNNPP
jgi:hypothetical protein